MLGVYVGYSHSRSPQVLSSSCSPTDLELVEQSIAEAAAGAGLPRCGGVYQSLTDTGRHDIDTCGPDASCNEERVLSGDGTARGGTAVENAVCSCIRPYFNTSALSAYDAAIGCLRARHAESVTVVEEGVVVKLTRSELGTGASWHDCCMVAACVSAPLCHAPSCVAGGLRSGAAPFRLARCVIRTAGRLDY